MSLTTAFYTGLSGMNANAQNIDVVGNNIANTNTPGFKASRGVFATQFTYNLSYGTPPSADSGGTNPLQVGLGTKFAGTQRNLNNGAVQPTGINTNLALEGGGYFIVEQGGERKFTRAGNFLLNQNNQLVDINGGFLQGFGVDQDFNIIRGALSELTVPVGTLTIAQATENVYLKGVLDASGDEGTTGSIHQSAALYSDAGGTAATAATNVATGGLWADVSGVPTAAIAAGSNTMITVTGAEKGGQDMGTKKFAFTTMDEATYETTYSQQVDAVGETLQDYFDFLENYFGLDNSTIGGQTLGGDISIDASGRINIQSNEGVVQQLRIDQDNMLLAPQNPPGPALLEDPFAWSKIADGDGESVQTGFLVYDSLGEALNVDVTFVKQSHTADGGTTWMFIAESADTDAADRVVGMGTATFDEHGNFITSTNDTIVLERENGAATPLSVRLNLTSDGESVYASASDSGLAAGKQDGAPAGTLSGFSIGTDGVISGSFSNGLIRTMGQVTIASFSNPAGLIEESNNLFTVGPNSGDPLIHGIGEFGSGRAVSGSLELSNVDIAEEFVSLITSSTAFSAASRVITTSEQLMQQLLTIAR